MHKATVRVVLVVFAPVVVSEGAAQDWPQWRGPNRDAVVVGAELPAVWPKTLQAEWEVEVGEGHAAPVVAGGDVYVHARQRDEEVTLCLNLVTGKERWRDRYHAPYQMDPVARDHGEGPKATPAVHGGRVYTFGISGILSAIDARTGVVKWRKEFTRQFPNTSPLYGTAASPLITDGLCIAHVGGHDKGALTAFDLETGAVTWSWDGDGPGYASPIVVTLAGEKQVVTQTQAHIVGVSAATGTLLWRIPFTTEYDQNIVTPLSYKDLLIFSGVGKPTWAIRLEKTGNGITPHEVWSNPDHPQYMSSPVLKGNRIFGMSTRRRGQLFCLDADTGRTLWRNGGRMGDNGLLFQVGDFVGVVTTDARLVLWEADAESYEPVAHYKVADSPVWAHPALVGNRLLIRDRTTVVCRSWNP